MILRQFLHSDPVGISYLIGCGGHQTGAVVDPVAEVSCYLEAAEAAGVKIDYVIDTHVHADHISTGPALAAISGMLLAPLLVVLALAASYQQLAQYPAVAGALRGMGAVASGLILAMALKMLVTLRGNVLGPGLCTALGLATLTAIAVLRLPLAWVVIGLGLTGWGLARWRIALIDARQRAARGGDASVQEGDGQC